MISHGQFFTDLLPRIGCPVVRVPALRTLAQVSIFESSQGGEIWWNPLACEQDWPGATNYNSAGVKIYPRYWAGVHATAELYNGPHWAAVRQALSQPTYRGPMCDAFTRAYTWTASPVPFATLNTTEECDARLALQLLGPDD